MSARRWPPLRGSPLLSPPPKAGPAGACAGGGTAEEGATAGGKSTQLSDSWKRARLAGRGHGRLHLPGRETGVDASSFGGGGARPEAGEGQTPSSRERRLRGRHRGTVRGTRTRQARAAALRRTRQLAARERAPPPVRTLGRRPPRTACLPIPTGRGTLPSAARTHRAGRSRNGRRRCIVQIGAARSGRRRRSRCKRRPACRAARPARGAQRCHRGPCRREGRWPAWSEPSCARPRGWGWSTCTAETYIAATGKRILICSRTLSIYLLPNCRARSPRRR